LARNGLIVSLGLLCASFLLLAGVPRQLPAPNSPSSFEPVPIDPDALVPDAAWRRVAVTVAQKEQLLSLRSRLAKDQRQTLREIGPKVNVLRRQLQIASATPGQEVRAA
jgi:hypothetical protein